MTLRAHLISAIDTDMFELVMLNALAERVFVHVLHNVRIEKILEETGWKVTTRFRGSTKRGKC